MNKKFVQVLILIVALLFLFPFVCQAKKYDPNDIITDLLFRYKKMKATDIQRFLENKGSGLKNFSMSVFGKIKRASEIIFDASRTYNVGEAVLLTLLQKEQALITTSSPTQYQLDWATGYGINRETKEEYKGFYNQVHWAAKALGYIYDTWRGLDWVFDVGKTKKTVDGYMITPKNYSTAKLYTYDPYKGGPQEQWGGNWLFWTYYNEWFGDINLKKEIVTGAGPSGGPHIRAFSLKGEPNRKTNFFSYSEDFRGGVRVALGDVDGDGEDEIVTGAGPGGGGQVRVFDVKTRLSESGGKVKKYVRSSLDFWPFGENFRGGVDVACGDVDQDGVDEIAMSQLSLGQCWVKVYKFNQERTILGEFRVFSENFHGGCTVAMGDVDGDQKDEVIVGSGSGMRSKVEIWKPWGKKMAIDFWPFHPNYKNGVDVASADVGKNGDDEIVVSQRSNAQAWVKVYDYRSTRDVVSEFRAYGDYTCGANVTASDLDGDGKMEIITGPGVGGGPHVRAFSLEGKPLLGLFAYDENFRGGTDVAVGVFEK